MARDETIRVPDIGDFEDVEVIDVLVAEGDEITPEQPLITLETDKASMDVPSPAAGRVTALKVAVGDRVSEGSPILELAAADDAREAAPTEGGDDAAEAQARETRQEDAARGAAPAAQPDRDTAREAGRGTRESGAAERAPAPGKPGTVTVSGTGTPAASRAAPLPAIDEPAFGKAHASPTVRRFARELGADIGRIQGSGRKGRILKEDVKGWVKAQLQTGGAPAAAAGGAIPALPEVDFSRFGEVEERELSRIKRLSGPHLHRAWLNLPMVTHHDEADVTELEAFRKSLKEEAAQRGVRVTALVFIIKALVEALQAMPQFNASLSSDRQRLILKKYYHIGIAVDTPNGLVVPVLRDADRKSVFALSEELAEVSGRARDGKLKPADLEGGCMSISSLGGIGGTAFTPIVNAPEVAILGVTRSRMQPVWNGREFVPRLMLPLDLTYDHRVIDGADAARFCARLVTSLGDIRRLLL